MSFYPGQHLAGLNETSGQVSAAHGHSFGQAIGGAQDVYSNRHDSRRLPAGKRLPAGSFNAINILAPETDSACHSQPVVGQHAHSQFIDLTANDDDPAGDSVLPSVEHDGYDNENEEVTTHPQCSGKTSLYPDSDLDEHETGRGNAEARAEHPSHGGKNVLPSSDSDVDNITDFEEGENSKPPFRDTDYRIISPITEEERNSESFRGFDHCTGGKFKRVDTFFAHKKRVLQRKLKAEQDETRPEWAHLTPEQLVQKASDTLARFEAEEIKTKGFHRAQKKARHAAKKERRIAFEQKKAREAAEKAIQDKIRLTYCGKRLPLNYREPTPNTPEPEEQLSSSPSPSPSPEPDEQTPRPAYHTKRLTRGNISQEEQNIDRALAESLELVSRLQAAKASLHASKSRSSQASVFSTHTGVSAHSVLSRAEIHRQKRRIVSDDEDEDADFSPAQNFKHTSSLPETHIPKSRKRNFVDYEEEDVGDEDFVPVKKLKSSRSSTNSSLSKHKRNLYEDESSDDGTDLSTPPKKSQVSKVSKPAVKKAASSNAGRPAGWTDEEHAALEQCVRDNRQQEQDKNLKPLRDMTLWNHMSAVLARDYRIARGGGACKNYWNRYGRARSGFDERSNVPGLQRGLVTSSQGSKRR